MSKIARTLALVVLLGGCATAASDQVAQTPPPEPAPYKIQAGDTLQVRFVYHPENDHEAVVRPDGKMLLPIVGETQAQGLTPAELASRLEQTYGTSLRDPKIAVTVKAMNENRIWVGGEVNKPGFVTLRQGLTALQAVLEAGGPKDTAKVDNVVLLQRAEGASRYTASKLNLAKALEGEDTSADRLLRASDVVFVPKTSIAKLDQFVDQYIIKVIPIRPTLPIF